MIKQVLFIFTTVSFFLAHPALSFQRGITAPPQIQDDIWGSQDGLTPLWESFDHPERRSWTYQLYQALLNDGDALENGAADITQFCPNYPNLSRVEHLRVWTLLFSAVAKFESGFNPTSRYWERTMGIDPITHQRVYSEGLLQLSYQDVLHYPNCNEFEWQSDRYLKSNDPAKTIFDTGKNLRCGVRIMQKQILQRGLIAIYKGAYWSTLRPSGHSALRRIQNLVKSAAACRLEEKH